MSGLLSSSAVFAAAIVVGATTTASAAASGNLLNRSEWTLVPDVHSQLLPKAESATQLAQAEAAETATEGETAAAVEGDGAAGEDDEPPIDPRATNALADMGETLTALQEIGIKMEATNEQVMDSGQKIEFAGTAYYRIRRPDRLRLDILTDTGGHQLYYDGKTVTLYTPGQEYYGRAEAKATIRDTIEWMEDTYGIETPLADLFDWGTERAPFEELQFAFPVGTSRVNGVLCGHYAFRTEETDWEVWIEEGTRHLPLKFAITDRTQDSLPRFEATLTWSTQEDFDDYIFAFSPSDDASEIPLTPLSEWAKLAKQE
jgi:hypothetical protein